MPEATYLHEVTGGYDNNKRRQVRELFRDPIQTNEASNDPPEIADLVVGVLEEFHAIAIREFTIYHVMKTLEIFGFEIEKGENQISLTLENPRISIYKNEDGTTFVLPDPKRIENLKASYCTDEKKSERQSKE